MQLLASFALRTIDSYPDPRWAKLLIDSFLPTSKRQFWDRWDRVSEMDAPAMWVFRTGLNLARSHARRRATEQRALADASETAGLVDQPEQAWADFEAEMVSIYG